MKIRQLTKIVLLMYLMAFSVVLSAQNMQIVIAELTNSATLQNVCLQDFTHVDNTHVLEDKITSKGLPAGQSGHVEFTINEMATSHITVSLQEENNPSVAYTIELNNGQVSYQGINMGNFNNGDDFKIARCGGEINFYRENVQIQLVPPITGGNFNEPLVAVVDVIAANNGADIALEFPHLVPHCVPDSQSPFNKKDFAAVKKQLDGSYVVIENNLLKFWYKERYAIANGQNNAVEYKIYDWKKTNIKSGSLVNCYGINWLQINVGQPIVNNEFLVLELTGPNKGETYFLRFQNYCENAPCTNQ